MFVSWGRQAADNASPGLTEFMICQILGQVLLKVRSSIKMQFSAFLHDTKVFVFRHRATLQTAKFYDIYVISLLLFRLESESF